MGFNLERLRLLIDLAICCYRIKGSGLWRDNSSPSLCSAICAFSFCNFATFLSLESLFFWIFVPKNKFYFRTLLH